MNSREKEMDMEAGMWELIVFVAESEKAGRHRIERLKQFFEKYLQKRYRIKLVSLSDSPEKAYQYDVIAVPTLIRLKPEPHKRIIGDFTDSSRLMNALDLHPPNN